LKEFYLKLKIFENIQEIICAVKKMGLKSYLIIIISLLCVSAFFTACLCSEEIGHKNAIAQVLETEMNNTSPETEKHVVQSTSGAQETVQTKDNNYENYYQEPVFKPGNKLLFVLQCAGFHDLYKADFNIAIIDCDDSNLTEKEIRRLKNQGKSIISYLSIGEAENYRSYWTVDWRPGNPVFIDAENPNWPGNFKVKFWDEQWQEIIFSKLDEIVGLGYDGVYLDLVDAYKYFEDKGEDGTGSVNVKQEMIKFVKAISSRTKDIYPQFLIIPQNAEELVAEKGYLDSIDGLGRENLWFEKNVRIRNEIMPAVLENLGYAKNRGKFIFAISYADDKNLADEFLRLCSIYGFIPYIGPLELNLVE